MQMGPPSSVDPFGIALVVVGSAILLYSSFLAIKATIRPGETNIDHPKNEILRDDR